MANKYDDSTIGCIVNNFIIKFHDKMEKKGIFYG